MENSKLNKWVGNIIVSSAAIASISDEVQSDAPSGSPLQEALLRMFNSLHAHLKLRLRNTLREWPRDGLAWGTAFSGCDILSRVAQCLVKFLREELDMPDLDMETRWACEKANTKQAFLMQQHPQLKAL